MVNPKYLTTMNAKEAAAGTSQAEKAVHETVINACGNSFYLGENAVYDARPEVSGLGNSNVAIVGGTGCGKTVTVTGNLVHVNGVSMIVTVAKRRLVNVLCKEKSNEGYKIIFYDTTDPECSYGYDPLDNAHSAADVDELAEQMTNRGRRQEEVAYADKYWPEAAKAAMKSFIHLEIENASYAERRPCFANVVSMVRDLEIMSGGKETNFDAVFEASRRRNPESLASVFWKSLSLGAEKTLSCIVSTLKTSVENCVTEEILELCRKDVRIDLGALGREKTMLIVNSSPFSPSSHTFINIMYGMALHELFSEAEKNENGRLDVPVHLVFDDFACGCRINRFEEYISLLREAGISVTLLLQSETQLESMYGRGAASTIINNCDTYLYMGGMDVNTCRSVADRLNKPLHYVLNLPLEQVVIFRRGSKPVETRRYQTYSDPVYIRMAESYENRQKKTEADEENQEEKA